MYFHAESKKNRIHTTCGRDADERDKARASGGFGGKMMGLHSDGGTGSGTG